MKIGVGAGIGAAIGAIAGGGKGAAIGAGRGRWGRHRPCASDARRPGGDPQRITVKLPPPGAYHRHETLKAIAPYGTLLWELPPISPIGPISPMACQDRCSRS